jgi:phosphopantothenoylcysteine decarboxylase/phosphopantothenate--cysteine ligase
MNQQKINILIGVTGGIAAYKAPVLCRLFIKAGFDVRVVLTNNATKFISPLTFEALTGNKVYIDEFESRDNIYSIDHIKLVDWADVIIIAPATANTIAKIKNGIADNLLTSLVVTCKDKKVFLCPSMNTRMYLNTITQDNINSLKRLSFYIIDPVVGDLACGDTGIGKMKEPEEIFNIVTGELENSGIYKNISFLITAGPTVEFIDPVRFISNRSSGKMGVCLASAAENNGGKVLLVGSIIAPIGSNFEALYVNSADDMLESLKERVQDYNILIMAAAVADYKPLKVKEQKIKKNKTLLLELVENPDILSELSSIKKEGQVYVGFAAETENIFENALLKLKRKRLDMIVVNDVSRKDIGFDSDFNEIDIILDGGGRPIHVPKKRKDEIASIILEYAVNIYKRKNNL